MASAPQEAARYGIGVLAPAMPQAVQLSGPIDGYALSPEPDPCAQWAGPPAPPGLEAAPGQEAPGGCQRPFPDYEVPQVSPSYALDLERNELARTRPVLNQSVILPRPRLFSAINARPSLSYGDRNWLYRSAEGPSVGIGNLTAKAPAWGASAPLGGVQVSDQFDSASNIGAGKLGYSSSVGRLNLMDPAATEGAMDYGAAAGSGTLRYGLTSAMTLEGQVQTTRGLTARGLGTRYNAGEIGTFEAGVTQSSFDSVNAWRYRFGYNVTMADAVQLGVTGEDIGAGFGDLSSYSAGAAATRQMRSTLSAGVPLRGMGTLSGTYSSDVMGRGDPNDRRVGLEHSMELAPTVRFALGADRDLLSGDYEWKARLSMPVDTFMRGHWLGF
ncbi:fimbrial protein [Bordetella pseudohinzii]|uniref:Fimbrial protein n=1 Tax=Bordetella pseudohinzii TaxID=1331258 RepID=A0ABM6DKM2_9BORD|nr:fimbrial protein [Bordetella pseudohinzii]KMM25657.1 fimbrial protein [Bordetella pseudohinzii]KXA81847.1 fimbrial protein [Bordetella pseudohinzii]KXA83202.1 fimbrial protein [Bordetella pseudohinzii]